MALLELLLDNVLPPAPASCPCLQPFAKDERSVMEVAVRESCDVVRSVLSLGVERAASGQRI